MSGYLGATIDWPAAWTLALAPAAAIGLLAGVLAWACTRVPGSRPGQRGTASGGRVRMLNGGGSGNNCMSAVTGQNTITGHFKP